MSEVKTEEKLPQKAFVVEELEKDAKTPRIRQFRLPKGQVQWLTYLLDKYGEDYKVRVHKILFSSICLYNNVHNEFFMKICYLVIRWQRRYFSI